MVADIDLLSVRLPALGHLSRRERQDLAANTRVYDVPPGTAIVRQAGPNVMIVKGCAIMGLLCREQRWTRVS